MSRPYPDSPLLNVVYSLGGALGIIAVFALAMVSFIVVMRGRYTVTRTIRNLPLVKSAKEPASRFTDSPETLDAGSVLRVFRRRQLENALEKRNNLVPGLTAAASGLAAQQGLGIGEVIQASRALRNARNFREKFAADVRLSKAIRGVVTAINIGDPQAESDKSLAAAIYEIQRADEEIEIAASGYNDILDNYNAEIQAFPGNVAAYVLGFERDDRLFPIQARRQ